MTSEPKAAEGVNASAAPELPPLQGSSNTAALSSAEGSRLGLPAGFTALPEVQPLRSVAETATLRQVQNKNETLPGLGQEDMLLARNVVPAAATELESPLSHNLLNPKEEENPAEQPTMSTPFDERSHTTERSERPLVGWSPFSPSGSQSTHGSSVGKGTPYLSLRQDAGSPRPASGRTSQPEPASPALRSRLSLAQRTRQFGQFVAARAAAAMSPGGLPGGLGQPEQSAQPGAVDPSYLQPTLVKTWRDVTNVQPQSTLGMAPSPYLGQTLKPDESPTSSLSVSGIQCREVGPHLPPTTGIQGGTEIPRAKAVAAVVSPHIIDPQVNPLVTTGIQSDTVALPLKESTISSLFVSGIQCREEPPSSVVAHISQPEVGIQRGRVTSSDIQSGPVSHLPTLPLLPTTDSHFDLPPLSGRRGG